jgi:hypothetical protein
MLPTLVLTDDAGAAATPCGTGVSTGRPLEPVGPAITWEDGRYLVAMAMRLAAREPDRIRAAPGAGRPRLERILPQ